MEENSLPAYEKAASCRKLLHIVSVDVLEVGLQQGAEVLLRLPGLLLQAGRLVAFGLLYDVPDGARIRKKTSAGASGCASSYFNLRS